MDRPIHQTTLEHFELFKERVKFWLEQFGLSTWDAFFLFTKKKSAASADLGADSADRNACFQFINRKTCYECELTPSGIDSQAFHEVCELVLWNLTEMLRPYYSDKYIDQETHKVIQRLDWGLRRHIDETDA